MPYVLLNSAGTPVAAFADADDAIQLSRIYYDGHCMESAFTLHGPKGSFDVDNHNRDKETDDLTKILDEGQ